MLRRILSGYHGTSVSHVGITVLHTLQSCGLVKWKYVNTGHIIPRETAWNKSGFILCGLGTQRCQYMLQMCSGWCSLLTLTTCLLFHNGVHTRDIRLPWEAISCVGCGRSSSRDRAICAVNLVSSTQKHLWKVCPAVPHSCAHTLMCWDVMGTEVWIKRQVASFRGKLWKVCSRG